MGFIKMLKKVFIFNTPLEDDTFILNKNEKHIVYDVRTEIKPKEEKVFKSYEDNLNYIKRRFDYPKNNDFVIKELKLFKNTNAFLIFYDGMVSSTAVDYSVIAPLLEIPHF